MFAIVVSVIYVSSEPSSVLGVGAVDIVVDVTVIVLWEVCVANVAWDNVGPLSPPAFDRCSNDKGEVFVFDLRVGSGTLARVKWWGSRGRSPASLVRCPLDNDAAVTGASVDMAEDMLAGAATPVENASSEVVELTVQ